MMQHHAAGWEGVPTQKVRMNLDDEKNRTLYLTEPGGVGYWNTSAEDLYRMRGDPLYIRGFEPGEDGSLIINVDCSRRQEVYMPSEIITYMGDAKRKSGEDTDLGEGRIIWNFTNISEHTIIHVNSGAGMIVAPEADLDVEGSWKGTMVAQSIRIASDTYRRDLRGTLKPGEAGGDARRNKGGIRQETEAVR